MIHHQASYSLDWLIAQHQNELRLKYLCFWGHTPKPGVEVGDFCFSQWFPASFTVDGLTYPTAEHWMMAEKARLFKDEDAFQAVLKSKTPGEAKKIGRRVRHFDDALWKANGYRMVIEGSIHKFRQNRAMGEYLINTGNRVLVEASPVDEIWGVGLTKDSDQVLNPETWRGLNLLGFALMEARDYLNENGF